MADRTPVVEPQDRSAWPEIGVDVPVARVGRRAMATLFEVLVPPEEGAYRVAAVSALDVIDEMEDQLSVYRTDSVISQLNDRAADSEVSIDPQLFEFLLRCAVLSREVGGTFDVTVGSLIKAWGFYRREGRVPTAAEIAESMGRCGNRFLVFEPERFAVRFLRTGLEINLGGVGKGHALDLAAESMRQRFGVATGLLHGGRSSVRALDPPDGLPRGWPVDLLHPWKPNVRLGRIHLKHAGLGVSAATHQHFTYNGVVHGHLLDPRMGRPAQGVDQAAVIAPQAWEADALSTAFYVGGWEHAVEYCRSRPEIGVVMLLPAEDRPRTINLTSATFTPD